MARAKRTDRADARRRYRATQSEAPELAGDEGGGVDSPTPTTPQPSAKGTAAPARATGGRPPADPRSTLPPGARPSFTASFRAAARPFDLRSDIAYIPTLALHTRAVWVPGLAAIASGAVFLAAQPLGSNSLANLAFQLFVLPPTIAGSFVAGILAPRATYIAGGIAALIGALVFAVAVAITPTDLSAATVPTPSPSAAASASASPSASGGASASAAPSPSASPAASPATGTTATTDSAKVSAIVQAVLLSVPFGVAIGAFGGYYKRFLYLSSPNRQRARAEQQRQKGQKGQNQSKRRF